MFFIERVRSYMGMIKIAHSVFALPFAVTAAFLGASGFPSFRQTFFIVLAMVGARSGAMGMNRVLDRELDKANPRTSGREIPAGKIRVSDALIFSLGSFGIMVFSAYKLNPLCLKLSPLAIVILVGYSLTKRFTSLAHVALGIAVSGATLGAWAAVRGSIDAEIVPLTLAVVFWLAGFDILYALQDIDFDKRHGLYSIPQKYGIHRALLLSRIFHIITFAMLVLNGIVFDLGFIYYIGLCLVGILLIYEHSLVKTDDLSRLNMAFFNMNGYISFAVFIFTSLAIFL